MRGRNLSQPSMFFAINVEDRIAPDHPLRPIRQMVDEELARLTPVFARVPNDVFASLLGGGQGIPDPLRIAESSPHQRAAPAGSSRRPRMA